MTKDEFINQLEVGHGLSEELQDAIALEQLEDYNNQAQEYDDEQNIDIKKLRNCAYTILDNAQAIMMECHNENPYPGYLLEKIKPIENDLKVIKSICMKGENI